MLGFHIETFLGFEGSYTHYFLLDIKRPDPAGKICAVSAIKEAKKLVVY